MKKTRISAITLLLIVAINALVAGYLFIKDPTGSGLQIPLSTLRYSPFSDFFIPGVILFTVNGVFNLIVATATLFKLKYYPALIAWQGLLLIGWIIIQIILLRDINLLHIILTVVGFTLFSIGNRLNV